MKKKIFSPVLLLTVVTVVFTSCLKDKGFDNHQYGINDPDTQPPGVGFPAAAKSKSDFGLNVSATAQAVNDLVYVNLESGVAASSDVHIALTNTTAAQVAAYNSANGTNIQVLPSNLYNVALTLTIPSGGRNVQVPLNVTNTTSLDPNKQYAVGLTISTVDGGYLIANNLKDLLIVFSVKNKYDGKYNMQGNFYHPVYEPTFAVHQVFKVEMRTAGPNDVSLYWPLYATFGTPLSGGGAPLCCFAAQILNIHVDPATNVATVYNGDATGVVYDQLLNSGSFGIPVNNPSVWDDANKTFKIAFGYNLFNGGLVTGSSRAWNETLTRTGPR